MALERKDRIRDTSTTIGTGTLSLAASAPTGYKTFVSAITSGAIVRYLIETSDKTEWEVGEGVFTDGSPDTLTRVTVYASSNSGSLVNFSAGTKNVSCVLVAKDIDEAVTALNTAWKPYADVVPTRSSSAPNSVYGLHVLSFAGVDITSMLAIGKKVKLTQPVTATTQALDLESGSSQYATKTDTASLSITGTMTVEAWIKVENLDGTGKTIVSKWHQDGNSKSYIFYISSATTLRFDYSGDGSNESGAASSACLSPADIGRWIHVAATITPSTKEVKFYKNGVLINTATATGTQTAIQDNATTFALGARDVQGTPDTFFDGLIAHVSVWNIVRTATQIQGDMFHDLAGNESGLVGYWRLNNAYTDLTANANDLTSSGSPTFSADLPPALTNATKYGYVVAFSFSTNTSVTIATGEDYGIDDGTISAFNFATGDCPVGFPDWLTATPAVDWTGTDPTGVTVTRLKFQIDGRKLSFVAKQNNTGAGTSNTQVSFDGLPVPPAYAGGLYNYPCMAVVSTSQDSGASTGSTAAAGFVYAGAPTIYAFFTSQAARSIYIAGFYEI